jgi:hypothetical protein
MFRRCVRAGGKESKALHGDVAIAVAVTLIFTLAINLAAVLGLFTLDVAIVAIAVAVAVAVAITVVIVVAATVHHMPNKNQSAYMTKPIAATEDGAPHLQVFTQIKLGADGELNPGESLLRRCFIAESARQRQGIKAASRDVGTDVFKRVKRQCIQRCER